MAEKTVLFKFEPGQKVKNALDEDGRIDSAALDTGGKNKYYVLVPGGQGAWWYEEELTALE